MARHALAERGKVAVEVGLEPIFCLRCQIMRSAPENLTELLRPVVESMGYELVGVELVAGERRGEVLRVYIDREGGILLDNRNIESTPIEQRDTKTVADVQMVFQNPFDTLNPSMTVGRQIIRALEIFGIGNSENERKQRMLKLLDLVKLPREFAGRMPRQLSGGQEQRVAIVLKYYGRFRASEIARLLDEPAALLHRIVELGECIGDLHAS